MITGEDNLPESDKRGANRFPLLTERERSVLRFASEGHTNIQIAEILHISKYTVAQHIAKMLRTTGASNRTDLVNRAYHAGVLTAESQPTLPIAVC
jgi:DNA-binding NarL/FixJ family response regulator